MTRASSRNRLLAAILAPARLCLSCWRVLDEAPAAFQECPDLLLLAAAGLEDPELVRFMGQIARQEKGIIRVGLVCLRRPLPGSGRADADR